MDKKTLLLEAVCELIKKDVPAADMRMSQIAASAGIAKSTVYEYFSSKDELVANALVYYAQKTAKELADNIPEGGTISSRLEALLDNIDNGIPCPLPIYKIISPDSNAMNLIKSYQDQHKFDVSKVFVPMLHKLVGSDDNETCMITLSSVFAYLAWRSGMCGDMSAEHARATCIKIIENT